MKTYKTVSETRQAVDTVTCNCCNEAILDECDPFSYGNYYSSSYVGGYGSKLGDMSRYSFDICEVCLGNWFDKFKIDPLEMEVDYSALDD